MIVTADRDSCLLIYPFPDWEEVERRLIRLPALNKQSRELQRLLLGYATELELDGHGRILLPKELREYAGLERQAMLIGQGHKLELWDEKRWNERCAEWQASGSGDGTALPPELESLSL